MENNKHKFRKLLRDYTKWQIKNGLIKLELPIDYEIVDSYIDTIDDLDNIGINFWVGVEKEPPFKSSMFIMLKDGKIENGYFDDIDNRFYNNDDGDISDDVVKYLLIEKLN